MIDTLLRYNANAPRYTSYPPANLFRSAEDTDAICSIWENSNQYAPCNLSFYFHIPFCISRCHFCGCTSEVCHDEKTKERYFEALFQEMKQKLPWIDRKRPVTQIHFGGGTPTSVSSKYLNQILDFVRNKFSFSSETEIAIECNPASFFEHDLKNLAKLGFNRISYGIQDFNLTVLRSIGRKPSSLPVKVLVELSRALGFSGINLDLIYGLPGQSRESFQETILKAIEADPDRIALFSYAHVPWVRHEQRQIEEKSLPAPREKMEFFLTAREMLLENGYLLIGMDHFVKPSDSLALAQSSGNLHRNFQGYCTQKTTGQVYSFGASAITQLSHAYLQNIRDSVQYTERIFSGKKTEIKCHLLSREEQILRSVLERLMCNFKLSLTQEEYNFLEIGFKKLCSLEKEGLVRVVSEKEIQATETGKLVIRYLAMQLDPLMSSFNSEGVFSKTI